MILNLILVVFKLQKRSVILLEVKKDFFFWVKLAVNNALGFPPGFKGALAFEESTPLYGTSSTLQLDVGQHCQCIGTITGYFHSFGTFICYIYYSQ